MQNVMNQVSEKSNDIQHSEKSNDIQHFLTFIFKSIKTERMHFAEHIHKHIDPFSANMSNMNIFGEPSNKFGYNFPNKYHVQYLIKIHLQKLNISSFEITLSNTILYTNTRINIVSTVGVSENSKNHIR